MTVKGWASPRNHSRIEFKNQSKIKKRFSIDFKKRFLMDFSLRRSDSDKKGQKEQMTVKGWASPRNPRKIELEKSTKNKKKIFNRF